MPCVPQAKWSVGVIILVGHGLLLPAGCSRGYDGPRRAAVSGSVTFDGIPITSGVINLIPTDGSASRKASAPIEGGVYRIPEPKGPNPGKCKVEISWLRPTGRKIESRNDPAAFLMVDETVEMIPSQYNTQTTLRVEIMPGLNKCDFQLTRN